MNGLSDVGIANKMMGGGQVARAGREFFPDPWLDYASLEMPKNLTNVLQWCEFLWNSQAVYRMACERITRYFITRIEVEDVNDEECEKYKDFMEKKIHAYENLALLGDDFLCYGNSFSTLLAPFDRFLRCPKCGAERPIDRAVYEFTHDFEFKGQCTACHRVVCFERKDRRSANSDEFRVVRWSPHYMLVQYNMVTQDVEYRYRFPEDFKQRVRRGDKFILRTTPWEMIEAIKDNKLFRFDKARLFHMKESSLAGMRTMGWGIPRMIANFRQAYYVQVLHRYNEALAIDYIVPFRLLTPKPGSSQIADPLLHQNLGVTKGAVLEMIAEHRRDPATWHFMPFPMEYQALGGEGMQMASHELIGAGNDELLNGMGVPAELYKGTLQLEVAPTALRLFQQTWPQIGAAYTGWLTWAARQIATIKNWEPATVKIQPVTLADDIEKKQILLQLSAAQQVSKGTAFGPFGIDIREEVRKIYDEQRMQSDMEKEFQREEIERRKMDENLAIVEQAQQPQQPMVGGMAGGAATGMMSPAVGGMMGGMMGGGMGGSPMGGGAGNTAMTPQQMMLQADQIAQQLLQMPYEMRKSEMLKLKQSDEALHALVKSKMEQQRNGAAQQGKAMLQQPQQ
jgi:hypothetical protein